MPAPHFPNMSPASYSVGRVYIIMYPGAVLRIDFDDAKDSVAAISVAGEEDAPDGLRLRGVATADGGNY